MKSLFSAVLASVLLACVPSAFSQEKEPLKKTEKEAKERVADHKEARHKTFRELERLRKDLRYISEELDREILGPRRDLDSYSKAGLLRLEELRRRGNIHDKLSPAVTKLEELYKGLPSMEYAAEYARGLVKSISHELRWIADEAQDEAELLKLLDENLVISREALVDGKQPSPEAWFPVDVTLEKFKRLGPIRVFLVKHRMKRPKSHAATDAAAILAGKHNVQIGVELTGKVTGQDYAIDQDYTFDFGALHIELTPEWRILHPKIPKPKVGDKVRIKGWTYFDIFHKAEEEYDPGHPTLGLSRLSQWEVHPVQEIEILPQ